MKLECTEVHAFADGELGPVEHQRFVRHLAHCDDCARELETIFCIGALVDQARGDVTQPLVAAAEQEAARPGGGILNRLIDWLSSWRWPRVAWAAAPAGLLVVVALVRSLLTQPVVTGGLLLAELQSRPYRASETRFAAPGFEAYRPLSNERGQTGEAPPVEPTREQQELAALEGRREHHTLGAVYLMRRQYQRAELALAAAGEAARVLNDRAVLAYEQGQDEQALQLAERALAADPGSGPALWNKGLVLQRLQRWQEAAAAFEACAALGESGWSQEARERAAKLRALGGAGRTGGGEK
jgi:cellulose synthase operon protein C